jgi:hypothetical protein
MRVLTAPLANRMVHVTWAPDGASWADGYTSGWRLTLPALPQDWQRRLLPTRATIAAFIRSRPDLLHREPAGQDDQGRPWPSGRTWDMLSTLLTACDATGANISVRWLLTAGAVGEDAATEYLRWEREARLRPETVRTPGIIPVAAGA